MVVDPDRRHILEGATDMEIAIAHQRDEDQIRQLLADSELPYQDITASHLRHFLIGWDGSKFAGVVGLEIMGEFALLRSLAVATQYRGRGIASALVARAEDHAMSQGVEAVYLLTMTAAGLFEKLGYSRVDRTAVPAVVKETSEFQHLCPSNSVCMTKRLAPS
jgi:amino-acid N-acetyltransferase